MILRLVRLSVLLLAAVFHLNLQASVNVAPLEIMITLADGQELMVIPQGNRQQQWVELADGELAVNRNGNWYLAYKQGDSILSSGQPLATNISAANPEAANVIPNGQESIIALEGWHGPNSLETSSPQSSSSSMTHYSYTLLAQNVEVFQQPLLVLRVSFSDIGFNYSLSDFQQTFFSAENSVKDYFQENSPCTLR